MTALPSYILEREQEEGEEVCFHQRIRSPRPIAETEMVRVDTRARARSLVPLQHLPHPLVITGWLASHHFRSLGCAGRKTGGHPPDLFRAQGPGS